MLLALLGSHFSYNDSITYLHRRGISEYYDDVVRLPIISLPVLWVDHEATCGLVLCRAGSSADKFVAFASVLLISDCEFCIVRRLIVRVEGPRHGNN
jgi:hypothetical protein